MWWTDLLRVACLAAVACSATTAASAGQGCPDHPGTQLKYVGLFDGPPGQQVQLQPDVPGSRIGYNDVAYIYSAGRMLYLECDDRDGTSTTLPIRKPVRLCVTRTDANGLVATFACH